MTLKITDNKYGRLCWDFFLDIAAVYYCIILFSCELMYLLGVL